MSYVNPLSGAKVTPERIDMGVDYAGTGPLRAIGNAVVTQVNPGGWGKFGNFIEYQLTDGPLKGQYVYYAEGVNSAVKVGQHVNAGDVIANLIPGWQYGSEIGFGSGAPNTAAAASYYKEGERTAAGQAFSDFIHALGAPAGTIGGRPLVGTFDRNAINSAVTGQAVQGGAIQSAAGAVAGIPGDIAGAISGAFNSFIDSIVSHAEYAALAFVAIVGGFFLMSQGAKRTTHAEAA